MKNELAQRAEAAMKELVETTNVMTGHNAVVEGMLSGLVHSHRTLQQSFVRAFIDVMGEYAESNTDLRNEAAVEFAKKIKEMEVYLPNI